MDGFWSQLKQIIGCQKLTLKCGLFPKQLRYKRIFFSFNILNYIFFEIISQFSFNKFKQANRIERQAFGHRYRMDIFRNFEKFFLALDCTCKNLKELVILCHGKVTQNITEARYFITEKHRTDLGLSKTSLQLHPNWILDSISAGKVEKFTKYIVVQ